MILHKFFTEDLVKILMKSGQRFLHQRSQQVLVRRSYNDPADLEVSLHDLVQVLVRRSCGDDKILAKRSLHE